MLACVSLPLTPQPPLYVHVHVCLAVKRGISIIQDHIQNAVVLLDGARNANLRAGHPSRACRARRAREADRGGLNLSGSADDGSKSDDDDGELHGVREIE